MQIFLKQNTTSTDPFPEKKTKILLDKSLGNSRASITGTRSSSSIQ